PAPPRARRSQHASHDEAPAPQRASQRAPQHPPQGRDESWGGASFAPPAAAQNAPPAGESIILTPMGVDSYNFEVIAEEEIDFEAGRQTGREASASAEEDRFGESPSESGREGEERTGRRRRRRRRGRRGRGRSADAPAAEGSSPARADEPAPRAWDE